MPDTTTAPSAADQIASLGIALDEDPVWNPDDDEFIVLAWGKEGTGKTKLALTFPKPIFLYDFEGNTKETVSQLEEKERAGIKTFRYLIPPLEEAAGSRAVLEKFKREFFGTLKACAEKKIKATFVIDSATEFWRLCRYATTQIDPKTGKAAGTAWVYAEANATFESVSSQIRFYRQRLFYTGRAESVWVDKQKTGYYSAEVRESALFASSVVIEVGLNPVLQTNGAVKTVRQYAFRKSQPNPALLEEPWNVINDVLTYNTLVDRLTKLK